MNLKPGMPTPPSSKVLHVGVKQDARAWAAWMARRNERLGDQIRIGRIGAKDKMKSRGVIHAPRRLRHALEGSTSPHFAY